MRTFDIPISSHTLDMVLTALGPNATLLETTISCTGLIGMSSYGDDQKICNWQLNLNFSYSKNFFPFQQSALYSLNENLFLV